MPSPESPQLLRVAPGRYVLLRAWTYEGARETWPLPAGFRTDVTSRPWWSRWLFERDAEPVEPPLLHDFLVRDPLTSRRDADGVFRRALLEEGVPPPRAWLMWAAVRIGSRLEGATGRERLQVLAVVALAGPYLLPPSLILALFVAGWRAVEYVACRTRRVC